MKKFQTSLLREKFIIHDTASTNDAVVALSNRILVELTDGRGEVDESFAVRAQNMHCCTRIAAQIVQSYGASGSLMMRGAPYDWGALVRASCSDYEADWNPQFWAVIYYQGKVLYTQGEHHPFFDVIEKCQFSNRGEYERAIPMAEDVFRTMGKVVRINYDGNYALSVNLEPRQARIGVIVRNPAKTATFNISAMAKGAGNVSYPQCLNAAAAFLEGIQLAFMVGSNEEKIRTGRIARHSPEERQTAAGRARLVRLESEIAALEDSFDVRYRPERPSFRAILSEAETMARGTRRQKI